MKKSDRMLNDVMDKLEIEFKSFRQEISEFKYIVDINALNKTQQSKLIQTIGKQKYYDNLDVEANFLVLKSKSTFSRIESTLNQFKQDTTASGRLTAAGGQQTERRASDYVLARSLGARRRLTSKIVDKTEGFLKYASPEFVAEFNDNVTRRVNRYNLKFNLPVKSSKELQQRLVNNVTQSIGQELKKIKPRTMLDDAMDRRVIALGTLFKDGKSLKSVEKRKTKESKKSRKIIKNKKEYYAPLRSTSGLFMSALTLQSTLNLLLHDVIQSGFMRKSGAASSKDYLRYQTGRFAKSAQVQHVAMSRGSVIVDYDYMTNPYESFRSGNNGPGRDPQRIIEGAIRQILITHVNEKFNSIIRKV
jgi:hypothetical protein